jgi:hypothetical protein
MRWELPGGINDAVKRKDVKEQRDFKKEIE